MQRYTDRKMKLFYVEKQIKIKVERMEVTVCQIEEKDFIWLGKYLIRHILYCRWETNLILFFL